MTTLIQHLDYLLKLCRNASDLASKRTFFDQAFGAVTYHIAMVPTDEEAAEALWDGYRTKFEATFC